jgi:flavodoxin I
MHTIGLFFGPEKGAVHHIATKIQTILGRENVAMISVKDANLDDLQGFEKLIFGISTVGKKSVGEAYLTTDWENFFSAIRQVDYSSKTIALFGLGDQAKYPTNFVDAMGILAKELLKKNAKIIGQVTTEAYTFEKSKAVINGKFIGLPLDEDSEQNLTDERLGKWLVNIKSAFGI